MGIVVGPTLPPCHTRCSTLHCPTCPTGLRRTIRSPDGSQIVTWTVRRTLLDSTGVTVDQMGHKLSHGPSGGLRWTGPDWTLLESKMAVESKEVCPVESAGLLCRTGLFWSPKRCPVDSAGLVHFQETYNIHIRYMFGGLCWTGLFWSPKRCVRWNPPE